MVICLLVLYRRPPREHNQESFPPQLPAKFGALQPKTGVAAVAATGTLLMQAITFAKLHTASGRMANTRPGS